MSLNMDKGQILDLKKADSNLINVAAACGWDVNLDGGASMDFDLAAYHLDASGKIANSANVCYFGNKTTADGSTASRGDNLTGEGEGDDETIDIALDKVSPSTQRIILAAFIYKAADRKQTLKSLTNGFIRIYNKDTNNELAKYEIKSVANPSATGFILGELIRGADGWTFMAVGSEEVGDLSSLTQKYGLAQAA